MTKNQPNTDIEEVNESSPLLNDDNHNGSSSSSTLTSSAPVTSLPLHNAHHHNTLHSEGHLGLSHSVSHDHVHIGHSHPHCRLHSSHSCIDINHTSCDTCSEDVQITHVHFTNKVVWLRAAVLGANDGLVSVSSLLTGVAAGSKDRGTLILSGVATLVAGAFSMACGEYVSVASQKDTEAADMQRERSEFLKGPKHVQKELEELAQIYETRGLSPELAMQVAKELHDSTDGNVDALTKIHLREELNVDVDDLSNPLEAAVVSALCFTIGGLIPLLPAVFISNPSIRMLIVHIVSVIGLLFNGAIAAKVGGANMLIGAIRVFIGGTLAMSLSYIVGHYLNIDT